MPAKTRRRKERTKVGAKEVAVRLVPVVSESTPFYYCNHLSVSHTRYDFVFTLARIPTTLSAAQRHSLETDQQVPLEASLQFAISPQLLPGVIRAMDEQRKKYEAQFGAIETGDDNDRQA